jgi:dihydrolipoamide dehydrogenase
MFAALGTKVTLVEALSRVLPLSSVDEDCSKVLQREMKKRKILVHLGRMVNAIEERSEMLQVIIEPSTLLSAPTNKTKGSITVSVDKVLVCIGRTPNSENMGLETIGLETDDNGWIKTNERLETNVANIYAIGDVLGPQKIMLAHVASAEGIIAADNAMGDDRNMNYRAVPGAIFTSPEVANVGLTESQARGQGHDIRSDIALFRTVGKAHVIGDIAGQVKIVSEVDTGGILGVHIIGPGAADLIAEATVAIQMKATTRDLAGTIHAHPTLSEVILEASSLAIDKPRHA